MPSPFLKLPAVCLLLSICVSASASVFDQTLDLFNKAEAEGKATWLLNIDNDSFFLNRDDKFYTSGIQIARQYQLRDAAQSTTMGWRFGQQLYTASDIKLTPAQVGPPDHPYAGWLYFGVYKDTHHGNGTYLRLGLDLGCLGPCAGGWWMQSTLHHILNQPLPQAWSTQMRNEIGAVLYAEVAPTRWLLGHSMDVTPVLHGRFGNIFSDAGGGVTLRVGRLNTLPNDPAWYGFVRADERLVAYNATLQGGYFSSNNQYTVAPKRLVGEAEIGLVWNDAPYGFNASIIRRGNEIRDLRNELGMQTFMRLQFSYTPQE